jgi:hypothetical protein
MEMIERYYYFQSSAIMSGLCVGLNGYFFKSMGLLDFVVWICFFSFLK